MKKFVALVFIALITACNPPQMTQQQQTEQCGPSPTMSQAEQAVATWVQRGGLKDPFSAQTRDIKIEGRGASYKGLLTGGGWDYGWVISFWVDAKNSFGAYSGWSKRYVVWREGHFTWKNSIHGEEPLAPTIF